ncbi:MAG: dockerin type I domain-containing protein, partial [Pirellulales bacterium]
RASYSTGGSPGQRDWLPGDANGDDRVDLVDVAIVQTHFGALSGATRSTGDLNGDGAVSRGDVALVAGNFGRSAAVPPVELTASSSSSSLPSAAAAAIVRSVRIPLEYQLVARRRRIATAGETPSRAIASHAADEVLSAEPPTASPKAWAVRRAPRR